MTKRQDKRIQTAVRAALAEERLKTPTLQYEESHHSYESPRATNTANSKSKMDKFQSGIKKVGVLATVGLVAYGGLKIKDSMPHMPKIKMPAVPALDQGVKVSVKIDKPTSQIYLMPTIVAGSVNGSFDLNYFRNHKRFWLDPDCTQKIENTFYTQGTLSSKLNNVKLYTNVPQADGSYKTIVEVQGLESPDSNVDYEKTNVVPQLGKRSYCTDEDNQKFTYGWTKVADAAAERIPECAVNKLSNDPVKRHLIESSLAKIAQTFRPDDKNPIEVHLNLLELAATKDDSVEKVQRIIHNNDPQAKIKELSIFSCGLDALNVQPIEYPVKVTPLNNGAR